MGLGLGPLSLPLLLDTSAAIWLAEGDPMNAESRDVLDGAFRAASLVAVSPITAWEIGLLISRGRLSMRLDPAAWFHALLDLPGMSLAAFTPEILVASSFLPGDPPRDPADRIIVATARLTGSCIITRDRHLLDYAQAGHLQALAC